MTSRSCATVVLEFVYLFVSSWFKPRHIIIFYIEIRNVKPYNQIPGPRGPFGLGNLYQYIPGIGKQTIGPKSVHQQYYSLKSFQGNTASMPCMSLAKTSTKSMARSYVKPWSPVRTSFGCTIQTTSPLYWMTKRPESIHRVEVIQHSPSTAEIVPMCIERPVCWQRKISIRGIWNSKSFNLCRCTFSETESNGGRYAPSCRRGWVRRRVWGTSYL